MALLTAVATLLGALFICLSPPPERHISLSHSEHVVPAFSCPYDDGDCGLLPKAGPAVLTVPPPDAPLDAGETSTHAARPPGAAGQARPDARPRAPGLHVLQVLRV
ncbi:hypothetical protein ACWF94_31180 [Streptomyces sp. NPDC055078]